MAVRPTAIRGSDAGLHRAPREEDGQIVFSMKHIPFADRAVLDQYAQLLSED